MEIDADDAEIRSRASGRYAVEALGRAFDTYTRRRLIRQLALLGFATALLITAALLVVFAPDGREHVAIIVAIALCITAAGAVGFATFWIKTPLGSGGAGEGVGNDP